MNSGIQGTKAGPAWQWRCGYARQGECLRYQSSWRGHSYALLSASAFRRIRGCHHPV